MESIRPHPCWSRQTRQVRHPGIVAFYQRQPTIMRITSRRRWRSVTGCSREAGPTLPGVAADAKLSPKYLPVIWGILHDRNLSPRSEASDDVARLPAPVAHNPDVVRAKCVEMRDFVVRIRAHTAMQFAAPLVKGLPAQSQPLGIGSCASSPRTAATAIRSIFETTPIRPEAVPRFPIIQGCIRKPRRAGPLSREARAGDADLVVRRRSAAVISGVPALCFRLPRCFLYHRPAATTPDSRTRAVLSAGYHSVLGFFRDDAP